MNFEGFYSTPYRWFALPGALERIAPGNLQATLERWQQPVPEQEKHWEFVAVALLASAHYPGRPVSPDSELHACLSWLLQKMPAGHPAANWRLMRQLVVVALAGRTLGPDDFAEIGLVPDDDGFLPDAPNDCSTQYHAYLALLLAALGGPEPFVRSVVQAALAWLVRVDDSDGDPNARGRGRLQLFGYASMAALAECARRSSLHVDARWHARVQARLAHNRGGGALPHQWDNPLREGLLMGYNTRDDYPAFADFWAQQYPATVKAADAHPANHWVAHPWPNGALCMADLQAGPVVLLEPLAVAPAEHRGLRAPLQALGLAFADLRRTVAERLRLCPPPAPELPFKVSEQAFWGGWWAQPLDRGLALRTGLVGGVHLQPARVWVREDFHIDESSSGCCEVSHTTWQRSESVPACVGWRGVNVRLVRDGEVSIVLSPQD